MARDHARLFVSIWADDDWRARTADAQWLYELLLTQPSLTYAGATDLRVGRWAASSADMTVARIEAALAELERHRYVVVDRDTEEVLVRSYLRVNEVWKQPKLLTLALRQVIGIQSPRLRSAMRSELLRLPSEDRTKAARTLARTLPDTPWDTLPDTPWDTLPDTRAESLTDTQPDTPTVTQRDTHAPGVRARAGATQPVTSNQESRTCNSLDFQKDQLGGSGTEADAREPDEPPPPDEPSATARPRCARHAGLPDDDVGPNCPACRDARLAAEAEAKRRAVHEQAAIRRCQLCDANGQRCDTLGQQPLPERCDHQPRPTTELASTGEFQRTRDEAQTVDCDTCPAKAAEGCRKPDGTPVTIVPAHPSRIRRAAARRESVA